MKPAMKWKKLGRIFCPSGEIEWMRSHAMIPIAEHVTDDIFRIYYSSRDRWNRGHGSFVEIDITKPQNILKISEKPILLPGELGCFDDSGALPNCIVYIRAEKYLYYTGINLGQTVPFRNSIGLAKWDEEKQIFERCFLGPIIDRTRSEPHFVATPEVIFDNSVYKVWYTSCVRWEKKDEGIKHFYHLKYAESLNGIDWIRKGTVAVDFKDQDEYALSVPRVIKDDNLYKMWFCSRAAKEECTYRIRYAESLNGVEWIRKDEEVGIEVSMSGWDSEMICYPYIFNHKGNRYMLYNGNGYGKTGFGIAVLTNG